jgi:dihydrofolate reductase
VKAERKVILYIATSLDGYIAKPGDDLSFLSRVQQEGEDYGYNTFLKTVDTVILGRKTYEWVMKELNEFPHSNLESYVITRTPGQDIGKIKFYTGNLKELIIKLKSQDGKNIFIDGGSEIVNELVKEKLIDQFCISIIPVLLGTGIRLFKDGQPEQNLKLVRSKNYSSGLVQLHYDRDDN